MSEEPSEGRGSPVVVVIIGLFIGLVGGVIAAWALSSPPDDRLTGAVGPPTTVAPETPEAAEAFIAAWERSRRETYLTVSEWRRVGASGAELREQRVFAQRPPDRVRAAGRNISGSVGGLRHTCDEVDAGEVACLSVGDETTPEEFDAEVEREVRLMWRHVEGTSPLYRVGQDGDCFHFRIDRAFLDPPYGVRTMWCFDPRSGAVSEFRIERPEATDTERLLFVTTDVDDDDLRAIVEGEFEAPGTEPDD